MTLCLTNTMTRRKEAFTPANPDHVTMYVCGPTVYNFAHIGNARPAAWFGQPTGEDGDTARIRRLVEARLDARSARDYATADRIRDELAALGITVEDRADGSGWRRTG